MCWPVCLHRPLPRSSLQGPAAGNITTEPPQLAAHIFRLQPPPVLALHPGGGSGHPALRPAPAEDPPAGAAAGWGAGPPLGWRGRSPPPLRAVRVMGQSGPLHVMLDFLHLNHETKTEKCEYDGQRLESMEAGQLWCKRRSKSWLQGKTSQRRRRNEPRNQTPLFILWSCSFKHRAHLRLETCSLGSPSSLQTRLWIKRINLRYTKRTLFFFFFLSKFFL